MKQGRKKDGLFFFTPLTTPRGFGTICAVKGKMGLPDNLARKERENEVHDN